MNESVQRQRREMRRAVARAVMVVSMCAFASPFAVSAQATTTPERTSVQSNTEDFPSFLFRSLAHYGSPMRGAVGGSLLISTKPWKCEDGFCGTGGIEVQALVGREGWRVGAGVSAVAVPLWADALVTVTRTRSEPRGASSESTYVGMEGAFSFPFYMVHKTVVSVRPSVGFARRVQGVGEPSDRTMFTWNVGATFLLPNY